MEKMELNLCLISGFVYNHCCILAFYYSKRFDICELFVLGIDHCFHAIDRHITNTFGILYCDCCDLTIMFPVSCSFHADIRSLLVNVFYCVFCLCLLCSIF